MDMALDLVKDYVVKPIADRMVGFIKQRAGYVISYKRKVAEMGGKLESLSIKRGLVEEQVQVDEINSIPIQPDVMKWLESVRKIEEETRPILPEEGEEVREAQGCLNLKPRYLRGEKVFTANREIGNLLQEYNNLNIKVSAHPRATGKVEEQSNTNPADRSSSSSLHVVGTSSTSGPASNGGHRGSFESRDLTFRKVMEALKDGKIRIIGLWGMGGVGKTTMMKELKENAEVKRQFGWILDAVVSQNPNLERIQQQIADCLGDLELKGVNLDVRATKLRTALQAISQQGSKKVLVLLDDIWEGVEVARILEVVGLSSLLGESTCFKIVLTSRFEGICRAMGVRVNYKMFQVEMLLYAEAWSLFREIARFSNSAEPELYEVAKKIVEECCGLPLAIDIIGKMVANNNSTAFWKDTLTRLEKSNLQPVYKVVESSLEFLERNEGIDTKDVFLLCCFFPEDFVIPYEDLRRYAWGLRLFTNINTMEEARRRVESCVDRLKGASLLLDSERAECVKMHDLVRDFGLNYKAGQVLTVNVDPDRCERIFLKGSSRHEILKDLECPNLKLLRVEGLYEETEFREDFYRGIQKLQVIDFRNIRFPFPPGSLLEVTLANLRTLCLHDCSLEKATGSSISMIANNLVNLEILSFAGSRICHLPAEVGKLRRLKVLDLTGWRNLQIDEGALKSLINLEELYMRPRVEVVKLSDTNYGELETLLSNKLTTLDIEIKFESDILPKGCLSWKNLRRFRISMGCNFMGEDPENKWINSLKLVRMAKSEVLGLGINVLFRTTESLTLKQVEGLNYLCEEVSDHFLKLKRLEIEDCFDLVRLGEPSSSNHEEVFHVEDSMMSCRPPTHAETPSGKKIMLFFPQLRSLRLSNLPKLVGFCKSGVAAVALPQLETLQLRHLPKFIPNDQKVAMPKLEKLEIGDMTNLTELWASVEDSICGLRVMNLFDCEGVLVNLFPSNLLPRLQNLQELALTGCSSVEVIFDLQGLFHNNSGIEKKESSCAVISDKQQVKLNLQLRELRLFGLPRMSHVWKNVPHLLQHQAAGCFQNLAQLTVGFCGGIKYLFSPLIAKSLVSLRLLEILRCDKMEEIVSSKFEEEKGNKENFDSQQQQLDHTTIITLFPLLNTLQLDRLPNLVCIGGGGASVAFGSFSMVADTVISFSTFNEKLDFPGAAASSASQTTCATAFEQSAVRCSAFHASDMAVKTCNKLTHVIPSNEVVRLQRLETLEVFYCKSVVEIFEVDGMINSEGVDHHITFPKLTNITLRHLPKLKYIWNSSSRNCPVLGFNCLTGLVIYNCDALTHVFTSSTLKSFEQLQELTVGHSKMIEVIVKQLEESGKEQEQAAASSSSRRMSDQLVFPRLKFLKLDRLKHLKGFSSGLHDYFQAPLLDHFGIIECPKMMIFTSGGSSTPELERVRISYTWYNLEGDLNFFLSERQNLLIGEVEEDEDEDGEEGKYSNKVA